MSAMDQMGPQAGQERTAPRTSEAGPERTGADRTASAARQERTASLASERASLEPIWIDTISASRLSVKGSNLAPVRGGYDYEKRRTLTVLTGAVDRGCLLEREPTRAGE